MLSETSGDFAGAPEHPERNPITTNANGLTDNLSIFIFFPWRMKAQHSSVPTSFDYWCWLSLAVATLLRPVPYVRDGTSSSPPHVRSPDVNPSLIVIGMTVTPIPVFSLRSAG